MSRPSVYKLDPADYETDTPWQMECCGGEGPPWCCEHRGFESQGNAMAGAWEHLRWDHEERRIREAATE